MSLSTLSLVSLCVRFMLLTSFLQAIISRNMKSSNAAGKQPDEYYSATSCALQYATMLDAQSMPKYDMKEGGWGR